MIIDKNDYFQDVEITDKSFKIDGKEIRGITKYQINYDSKLRVISLDLSIDVKSVKNFDAVEIHLK